MHSTQWHVGLQKTVLLCVVADQPEHAARPMAATHLGKHVLDHRNGKRSCLAAAGLCTAQDVTATQAHGNALRLDGRWPLVPMRPDVPQHSRIKVLVVDNELLTNNMQHNAIDHSTTASSTAVNTQHVLKQQHRTQHNLRTISSKDSIGATLLLVLASALPSAAVAGSSSTVTLSRSRASAICSSVIAWMRSLGCHWGKRVAMGTLPGMDDRLVLLELRLPRPLLLPVRGMLSRGVGWTDGHPYSVVAALP